GNGVVGTGGTSASVVTGPTAGSTTILGGGVPGGNTIGTADHAVRLFNAVLFYDFHPCGSQKGCSCDCPEGTYRYVPTFTVFAGKYQPFFCLEEILGSGVEQFVEFSMANWFFDADDNNEQTMVGFQYKGLED